MNIEKKSQKLTEKEGQAYHYVIIGKAPLSVAKLSLALPSKASTLRAAFLWKPSNLLRPAKRGSADSPRGE
tara:strand:- start:51 stop:263 length:213 start_codon:yes stop_codon:yes gene_type:complete